MSDGSWGIMEQDFYSLDRVAEPDDFGKKLDASVFRDSQLLRDAGRAIESGRFEDGLKDLLAGLKQPYRKITLEFDAPDAPPKERGTRQEGDSYVMMLPHDFNDHPPAEKIWELLHRNMSIVLQRSGERQNELLKRDLLKMDIAYAQSLRRGIRHRPPGEHQALNRLAMRIEGVTRSKRAWARPMGSPPGI